jgi:hypothetical protein
LEKKKLVNQRKAHWQGAGNIVKVEEHHAFVKLRISDWKE